MKKLGLFILGVVSLLAAIFLNFGNALKVTYAGNAIESDSNVFGMLGNATYNGKEFNMGVSAAAFILLIVALVACFIAIALVQSNKNVAAIGAGLIGAVISVAGGVMYLIIPANYKQEVLSNKLAGLLMNADDLVVNPDTSIIVIAVLMFVAALCMAACIKTVGIKGAKKRK